MNSLLGLDASNRAVRSFIQGLAIDVAVAVAMWAVTVVNDAAEWGDVQWAIVGFTLAKTLVQSVAAYVMRRYLDPSKVPTPLPPEPPGEPNVNVVSPPG